MDPSYLPAIAVLAGSTIGGLTSLAASWLSQRVQFSAQYRATDLNRREELYKSFIQEASRLYAYAFEHDHPEVSNLVNLYALVSQMRVLSSAEVVAAADRVGGRILETYLEPNRSFHDVKEIMNDESMNPLREFSAACRDDLHPRGGF
ncbi:MAG TPA: hypothetical protein VFH24_02105 [Gemmatimonadales bacterium]|nr:hypothetical protein [Gemmatimonadales bacterium]